jgi:hypothetical protein
MPTGATYGLLGFRFVFFCIDNSLQVRYERWKVVFLPIMSDKIN